MFHMFVSNGRSLWQNNEPMSAALLPHWLGIADRTGTTDQSGYGRVPLAVPHLNNAQDTTRLTYRKRSTSGRRSRQQEAESIGCRTTDQHMACKLASCAHVVVQPGCNRICTSHLLYANKPCIPQDTFHAATEYIEHIAQLGSCIMVWHRNTHVSQHRLL